MISVTDVDAKFQGLGSLKDHHYTIVFSLPGRNDIHTVHTPPERAKPFLLRVKLGTIIRIEVLRRTRFGGTIALGSRDVTFAQLLRASQGIDNTTDSPSIFFSSLCQWRSYVICSI